MTKPIVSLGVMMLYEEGRFQLNDPVSKYIPEFGDPKVLVTPKEGKPYTIPATQPITIRHLLTHTSGLSYNWDPALGSFYKEANIASGLLPSDETIGECEATCSVAAAVSSRRTLELWIEHRRARVFNRGRLRQAAGPVSQGTRI
jgi:CubicO group peptidase (beta-lactamase class C family)